MHNLKEKDGGHSLFQISAPAAQMSSHNNVLSLLSQLQIMLVGEVWHRTSFSCCMLVLYRTSSHEFFVRLKAFF